MSDSTRRIDSYRWLPRAIAEYYRGMQGKPKEPVPWTPLAKPLNRCMVAAVTTAGIYIKGEQDPFDVEREKREPTWGDPTFREIRRDVAQEEIGACHLHINNEDLLADFNIALPLRRLEELAQLGAIGRVAPRHLSFMGFQLDDTAWRETYAPRAAALLKGDGVDCVILAPA